MNKKYIISLLAIAAIFTMSRPVVGQNSLHELSLYGGLGQGILKAKTASGVEDKSAKFGQNFGVGYTYYISPSFALQTGLEYSTYNNELSISASQGSYEAIDNDAIGERFDFRYKLDGYQEKLKSGYLQIPVMIQYLTSIDDSKGFFVSAGMKLGFVISKSYDNSLSSLTTEGYYPDMDVALTEDFPDLGFGKYTNISSVGDFKLKTAFIASVETGVKWKLSEDMSLYTGVYFDYGLNNVNETGDKHLVEYNRKEPSNPILNSAALSIRLDSKQFVERINLMALGVKVKMSFAL